MEIDQAFEERVIQDCNRRNIPLPKRIAERPEPEPWMDFYFTIFAELSSERQVGFGYGPIPVNSILLYCHLKNYNDLEDDIMFFVKKLDDAFMKKQKQDNERKMKTKNG